MHVRSDSGADYDWPISSGRAVMRRRAGYSGRARSTRWCTRPSTATRRCRTRFSSTANTRSTARDAVGSPRPAGLARLHPAFARTTPQRCSRWSGPKAPRSASSARLKPRSFTAVTGPIRRLLLRPSVTPGRLINGRMIRSHGKARLSGSAALNRLISKTTLNLHGRLAPREARLSSRFAPTDTRYGVAF